METSGAGDELKLSQFGPAFAWLLARDISSERLGTLFGTTPGNIRVMAFRSRHTTDPVSRSAALLTMPVGDELAKELGIRADPDFAVHTPVRGRSLESLKNQIEQRITQYAESYEFLEGSRALRRMLPLIGYAGDSRRVALRALIHQHMAWFLVHSGRCSTATEQASIARDLWRKVYQETGSHDSGAEFVRAALIESQAHLLLREPARAMAILDLARDAAQAIGDPLGSEHSRQRGVALFQLRHDEDAAKHFQRATELMEKLGEARLPEQLLMTGLRHLSLLGNPNYDKSQEVLGAARRAFGIQSLEASMALNWAAACALLTDSHEAISHTIALLHSSASPAPAFGHQVTIRRLLAVTADLGLDDRLRRAWVRRALYENAVRAC